MFFLIDSYNAIQEMGQTAQSYFEVNLNEKYGIAGEAFHGKLEIRINCDDFYARFVQIRLIGEELINDQLQHSIIQTDWITVHVFQDRHLARGFYEYPVELTLPSALPSSIKSRKITGKAASYSCEIRYYVEVKINRENFVGTHLKEIHLPIIMFNPLPLIYANSQEQEFLPPQKFDVLKEDTASSTATTTDNLLGTRTLR